MPQRPKRTFERKGPKDKKCIIFTFHGYLPQFGSKIETNRVERLVKPLFGN